MVDSIAPDVPTLPHLRHCPRLAFPQVEGHLLVSDPFRTGNISLIYSCDGRESRVLLGEGLQCCTRPGSCCSLVRCVCSRRSSLALEWLHPSFLRSPSQGPFLAIHGVLGRPLPFFWLRVAFVSKKPPKRGVLIDNMVSGLARCCTWH